MILRVEGSGGFEESRRILQERSDVYRKGIAFRVAVQRFHSHEIQELTMKDLFNGISSVNSSEFMLRGKNYLKDGKKFPPKKRPSSWTGKELSSRTNKSFIVLNLPPLKKWLDKHKGAAESFYSNLDDSWSASFSRGQRLAQNVGTR